MIHPNSLCQLELHSRDVEASLNFFAKVFGWPALPITLQDYYVLMVPEDSRFGISVIPAPAPADSSKNSASDDQSWTIPPLSSKKTDLRSTETGVVPYFRMTLPTLDFMTLIEAHHGKVCEGPRTVTAYGVAYKIEDPGGIKLGIFIPHVEEVLNQVD